MGDNYLFEKVTDPLYPSLDKGTLVLVKVGSVLNPRPILASGYIDEVVIEVHKNPKLHIRFTDKRPDVEKLESIDLYPGTPSDILYVVDTTVLENKAPKRELLHYLDAVEKDDMNFDFMFANLNAAIMNYASPAVAVAHQKKS